MKQTLLLACSLILFGCTQTPERPTAALNSTRTTAQRKHQNRTPADATPPAPVVNALAMPLYSWSNDASLLVPQTARTQLAAKLAHAESCLPQIAHAKSDDPITGCEGNGMAAGPGLYACDNPFTSHDYGHILISATLAPVPQSVALVTGSLTPPPASGGLDRAYTGNSANGALVYNFRDDDFGGRAISIRDQHLIDFNSIKTIETKPTTYNTMAKHPAFACNANTNAMDVVAHWADQMEFLALTYVSSNDSSGNGFVKDHHLTGIGVAAAISSDLVAKSDADLAAMMKGLLARHKDLQLGTQDCQDLGQMSPRACMASIVFNSIVGNMGTGSTPTNAWDPVTTIKVLTELKVAPAAALSKISSNDDLVAALAKFYTSDANQTARALEAYDCMNAVKSQVNNLGLHSLGPDPQ